MTQDYTGKFRKALLEEGFEAAVRIRDARKAELEQTRERLQRELDSANAQLASLQKDFAGAVRDAQAMAGVARSGDRGVLPGRTYADWVTDTLAEHGGTIFGPVLYDCWQHETGDHSRKNRLKIQSVVSQLIAKDRIRKVRPDDMPEIPTSGRRGSVLVLKEHG